MRLPIPGAAKALIALTAAGLLLSGCYAHPRAYVGTHFAPPAYGHSHHAGKPWKHGQRHRHDRHERHRHDRHRGHW